MNHKVQKALRWLQLLVGVPALVYGLKFGERKIHLLRFGTKMQGQVVSVEEKTHRTGAGSHRTLYIPIIAYEVNGQRYTFRGDVSAKSTSVNYAVDILVDTSKPEIAMRDHPLFNYYPWSFLLIVGFVLLLSFLRYFASGNF